MISSKNSSANKGGTEATSRENSPEATARFLPELVPDEMLVSPAGRTYQVIKYLSQGNYGVVWLVQEVPTGDLRAMKMPLRRKELKAFEAEAELHSSLASPFVVDFIEAFELRGWPVRPLRSSVCVLGVGFTAHKSRVTSKAP
jgi:serine/threonine protein kinase